MKKELGRKAVDEIFILHPSAFILLATIQHPSHPELLRHDRHSERHEDVLPRKH